MKAIQLTNSVPRYAVTKVLGALYKPAFWGPTSILRYRDVPEPPLPGPEWARIRTRYGGICGSDLQAITASGSPLASAFVSFPFTLGHENVGFISELGAGVANFAVGDRVVVDPLLPCAPRGIDPPCMACQGGEYTLCRHFTDGAIAAGIALGACHDTGGSWSPSYLAHRSQLFAVPNGVSDENAVMAETFSIALHSVAHSPPADRDNVIVVGAGVIGLCVVSALRALGCGARVIVLARYPFQAAVARTLGADEVMSARGDPYSQLADITQARVLKPVIGRPILQGGADVVFECSGSNRGLDDSLRLARSGGTVAMIGSVGVPKGVDLTPIWLKELTVRGSVYCGTERLMGHLVRPAEAALAWMAEGRLDLSSLVTHRFRLEDYKRALAVTSRKGRNRVIKSVFVFD